MLKKETIEKRQQRFLDHQNTIVDEITLKKKQKKRIMESISYYNYSGTVYFSTLEKEAYIGIVEIIYGVKFRKRNGNLCKNKVKFQKIAVIPANKDYLPLCRNLIYCNCTLGPKFRSYGYEEHDTYSYKFGYDNKFYVVDNDYFKTKLVNCLNRTELFDVNDLIKFDKELKYCSYDWKKTQMYAIEYISFYKKYPICEMLFKLNLGYWIGAKGKPNHLYFTKLSKDKKFQRFVAKNTERIRSKYTSLTTTYRIFKSGKSFHDLYEEEKIRLEHRRFVSDLNFYMQGCNENRKAFFENIKEDLFKYFIKQAKLKGNIMQLRTYIDYITACEYLNLNINEKKVLFPHNFMEMHDLYTKQYQRAKDARFTEAFKTVAEKFSFVTFAGTDYHVLIAQSKSDLISEGNALHHCVGRMNYDQKMANGESFICFLRKSEDVNKPYVTIEVGFTNPEKKTLKVLQCYGDHNAVIPEIRDFVDSWIKKANRKYSALQKKQISEMAA